MYSQSERDEIVLEYFSGAGADERPSCPRCGEDLEIESQAIQFFGLQLQVRCDSCSTSFAWSQPQPERPWKDLYLDYFAERYLRGEDLRCPHDDAFVTHAEFSDGVVQFNCPYCNRRGRVIVERASDEEE